MNIDVLTSVSFKCTAQGFGKLKIVWKRVKHNMPVTAEITEEKTLNKITSILKFTKTIGYYSGQYYCVAEGKVGEVASQTASLHIQGNNKISQMFIITLSRLMIVSYRRPNKTQLMCALPYSITQVGQCATYT